jgi:hypothetical protein
MLCPENVVYADPFLVIVEVAGHYYYRLDDFDPLIFMPGDQRKEWVYPTPEAVLD